MLNFQELQLEYIKSYKDKTRIYFIEHYLSTMSGEKGMQPLILFPRQKAFLQSLSEHKESIAIKHRQAGITTITSAWAAAQMVFAAKGSPETVLCIGNKLDLANQLVEKMRAFLEQIPRWFWGDEYYSPDPKSEKNKKDIFVKCSKSELELFNGCKVYARSSGPNASRGISSVSLLVFDEAAFIENGASVYAAAVAATSARPNRKIVMISTPNGKDSLYYNTYKQAQSKENNYNAVEFKWFQDLRYNKFLKWYKKNEESGELDWIEEETLDATGTINYDEERWRDLERKGWTPTSPWYISMCKAFNNDSMMIAQELDGSFMGSSNNVVAPEYIEMQQTLNVREPLKDMKDPMVDETWFWKPPIKGHRYLCACLPECEKVLTKRGLINVENVEVDDELVTKDGVYTKIKYRKYRNVIDEKIIKIQLYNIFDSVSFTHNHPIWSSINCPSKKKKGKYNGYTFNHEFNYHNASEITKDCFVEYPNIYYLRNLSDAEILKHWEDERTMHDKQFNPILDTDFWWYCGMWLAEGYVHNNATEIVTTHNTKEIDVHNKINDIAYTLFNRECKIKHRENNSTTVRFFNSTLSNFLNNNFGRHANGKHINEWIKFLPLKYKIKLLQGYFKGDGWVYQNKQYATSVSKTLLNDIQDILFSIGITSSLKVGKKQGIREVMQGKLSNCLQSYEIVLNEESTRILNSYWDGILYKPNYIKKYCYFSDDLTKIYIRVKNVEEFLYTGKVYNFETISDSHSFCSRGVATHNCDPSRGTSEDRTAIEIIDMDGEDENGLPIIEQVAEYIGKRLGDDIGAMVFQYATMYNNAYVVFDATGGQSDAAILTMMQLGYKNFYYEDNSQKTYMVQNPSQPYTLSNQNQLCGFHFQGNRYPVLANFATMVRQNEIKIRSMRVINELETWIFKGEAQRMDHMDGMHDDSITSMAMGLFVMRYTLNKVQDAKNKDVAVLGAYFMNNMTIRNSAQAQSSLSMTPKSGIKMPFYNNKTIHKYPPHIQGTHLWVFGGMY